MWTQHFVKLLWKVVCWYCGSHGDVSDTLYSFIQFKWAHLLSLITVVEQNGKCGQFGVSLNHHWLHSPACCIGKVLIIIKPLTIPSNFHHIFIVFEVLSCVCSGCFHEVTLYAISYLQNIRWSRHFKTSNWAISSDTHQLHDIPLRHFTI